MLETKIEKLTVAIDKLTEAMLQGVNPVATLDAIVEETIPTKDESVNEVLNSLEEVSKKVKELAKEKIKAGVKRKDIKAMITKLGADSISDLSIAEQETLYKQLEAL